MLQVRQVSKKYGKFAALDDVSFEASRGTHTLVLGPNGAGKTTLLKCMMGMVGFGGSITINGVEVKRDTRNAKTFVGYVPQNYAFYENLSVLEHAKFSSRLKGTSMDHFEQHLQTVDLWEVRRRKVKALSDGMKQRLGLALALIGNPLLLLLDEPTSNIDLKGQLDFQELLKGLVKEGKTVVTTTHLSGMGDSVDEAVILDHGKLIAKGPPDQLLLEMNANDTIYVKVRPSDVSKLAELLGKVPGIKVVIKGDWVRASVRGDAKVGLIQQILKSGYEVQDLMVEHSRIESSYLGLLGGTTNN